MVNEDKRFKPNLRGTEVARGLVVTQGADTKQDRHWEVTTFYHGLGLTGSLGRGPWTGERGWGEGARRRPTPASHKSSYCLRCILWMMSRQSLKTLRMFSVSTAQVKCG